MELRPASPTAKAPATNFTEADYERLMDINLKSAFFGTQFAAKQFIAQGDGGIVINISSVHEDWPMPGNVAYCVSKGGTRMLTRTAGVELGPHESTMEVILPAIDGLIGGQHGVDLSAER
jgi:glucose 1-dehydrogenase